VCAGSSTTTSLPPTVRGSIRSIRRPAVISGQCEYVSETDSAVLKVLLKVKPGLGEGYDWVECNSCGAGWQVPYFTERVG
jgi:hypothetical protein